MVIMIIIMIINNNQHQVFCLLKRRDKGLVLDDHSTHDSRVLSALGKNDGSVGGIRYFACKPRYGSFVRPDKVTPIDTRTPPTRRDQKRSGSRRSLASRKDSPSRNAVAMHAQAGANRRKNEWKRRSNILF